MKNIVVDIWGGEASQEWVARFILPVDEALKLAKNELSLGYLVNLRASATFGPEQNFDSRINKLS